MKPGSGWLDGMNWLPPLGSPKSHNCSICPASSPKRRSSCGLARRRCAPSLQRWGPGCRASRCRQSSSTCCYPHSWWGSAAAGIALGGGRCGSSAELLSWQGVMLDCGNMECSCSANHPNLLHLPLPAAASAAAVDGSGAARCSGGIPFACCAGRTLWQPPAVAALRPAGSGFAGGKQGEERPDCSGIGRVWGTLPWQVRACFGLCRRRGRHAAAQEPAQCCLMIRLLRCNWKAAAVRFTCCCCPATTPAPRPTCCALPPPWS